MIVIIIMIIIMLKYKNEIQNDKIINNIINEN